MKDRFYLLRFDGSGGGQIDLWFSRKQDAQYHLRRHARNGDGTNFRLMRFEIPQMTGLRHSSPKTIATYVLRMLGGPAQQQRNFVAMENGDAGNEDAIAELDNRLAYEREREDEDE